jgi:hypothetical protein
LRRSLLNCKTRTLSPSPKALTGPIAKERLLQAVREDAQGWRGYAKNIRLRLELRRKRKPSLKAFANFASLEMMQKEMSVPPAPGTIETFGS